MILRFSFGAGSGPGVKILGITGPDPDLLQFRQLQESVWKFLK